MTHLREASERVLPLLLEVVLLAQCEVQVERALASQLLQAVVLQDPLEERQVHEEGVLEVALPVLPPERAASKGEEGATASCAP